MYNFIKAIVEGKTLNKLEQLELPYSKSALDPSLSKEIMDYHFDTLYKGYVDRFNKGEGDADFNEAGAFLHRIYFSQFKSYSSPNKPTSRILEFIEQHHKSWDRFLEEFEKVAMKIQGSGWVYLAKNGEIKTIANHQIKNDIVLIIDWWEHSFMIDFGSDKKKYLKGQWKIIDWNIIEQRI